MDECKKLSLEFELDPFLGLGMSFKGVPKTEKERANQKEGIVAQKVINNHKYQIKNKGGKYFGKISVNYNRRI